METPEINRMGYLQQRKLNGRRRDEERRNRKSWMNPVHILIKRTVKNYDRSVKSGSAYVIALATKA
ncbi:MAG: hypothetical protein ACRD47_15910 [Nitrososphaeraceae archaeon]